MGPSILNIVFIGFSLSHDLSQECDRLTQLTQFFLNWLSFFLLILSFNIVFDWELSFMICFNLLFIMLFQPHDPGIVFNGLIRVNLAHFSCHFFKLNFVLILSFNNWIRLG